MWYRLSIGAIAAFLLAGVTALAAELPTYEVMGFPMTQSGVLAGQKAITDNELAYPSA
jgi:hypothetical protein